jgi:hypothetical protein
VSKKQTLKQLKAKWYKVLKDEGFKDIETNENYLKDSTIDRVGRNTFSRLDSSDEENSVPALTAKAVWNAKQDYYYYAEHFLNDYKFDSELEKNIWKLHSEGISVKDIFKTLPKQQPWNLENVEEVIRKLVKEMKINKGIK